jgi:hypothetical protein
MAEYVAAAAAIIGAGVAAYSAVEASEERGRQAKRQRQLDIQQAERRKEEAEIIKDTAAFEERQHRRQLALMLGKQRAGFAAAGYAGDIGTPLSYEIDLVKEGELEALSLRRAGAIGSRERLIESDISLFQANTAHFAQRSALRQIPLQIAGGVAGAVSSGVGAYTTTQYYRRPRGRTATSDIYYGD